VSGRNEMVCLGRDMRYTKFFTAVAIIVLCVASTSCSVKKMAMKSVASAMSSGGNTLQSEADPELVGDALPFILVMYEMLLAERPDDPELLLAASKAFTMYSYGYIMTEADMSDGTDFRETTRKRKRASSMFLRARGYALHALEQRHPGFKKAFGEDYRSALLMTGRDDVDLLYWCGAAGAAALSAAKDNLELMSALPKHAAMVERVLELDDEYAQGAAHDFFISYYGSRPEAMGGSVERAREHFRRSIEISKGRNAGTYLALAASVSVKMQDAEEFRALLNKALEIDVDDYPESRLSNLIMQKRARWLLENTEEFFLEE
jgi:predicted anti-sigma-YlaC factor YlaD